jgi:cyanophycinase
MDRLETLSLLSSIASTLHTSLRLSSEAIVARHDHHQKPHPAPHSTHLRGAHTSALAARPISGVRNHAAGSAISLRSAGGGGGGKANAYEDYIEGSSADVTVHGLQGGLVLQGGSYDFKAPFEWMRDTGNARRGDFVVIRASGTDAYNPYIYSDIGGFDSVETLIVKTREAANNPVVAEKVRDAEAVWIAGGDQADYVQFWKGTALADAVNWDVNVKHTPIGGTSAGLAVMGEYVFAARKGTIDSATALGNPYSGKVDLDQRIFSSNPGQENLPFMDSLITDSHFVARDRMGRLVTFLARLNNDDGLNAGRSTQARGIGINEQTALVVDRSGIGTVLSGADTGNPDPTAPYVYILTPMDHANVTPKQPLTYHNIAVHRLTNGDTFDLATWMVGTGGEDYTLDAADGVLTARTPSGVSTSIYG